MELDSDATLWSHGRGERAGQPLLVLLHGYGSHEGDLFALRPFLPEQLVIAALRAPLAAPPGFAWFPVDSERPLERNAAAARNAAALLADWIGEHAGAASSVGLLGFSQGAMISLLLLRNRPELADYAVLLSGGMLEDPEPADARLAELRPPVFFGYGTADTVIPAGVLERTAAWLPERTTLTARRYPGLGHSVSQPELVDVAAFLRARLEP